MQVVPTSNNAGNCSSIVNLYYALTFLNIRIQSGQNPAHRVYVMHNQVLWDPTQPKISKLAFVRPIVLQLADLFLVNVGQLIGDGDRFLLIVGVETYMLVKQVNLTVASLKKETSGIVSIYAILLL
jgi:hypothetical protein